MNSPYYGWGQPMPPPYAPMFPDSMRVVYVPAPADHSHRERTAMDAIQEAENAAQAWKAIVKRLKEDDKKDDDKKKETKGKFSWAKVVEVSGYLSVLSFPVILAQYAMFHMVAKMLHGN